MNRDPLAPPDHTAAWPPHPPTRPWETPAGPAESQVTTDPAGGTDPAGTGAYAPVSPPDDHPPPPPDGRYVPRQLHRAGGLGAVWLARDTVLGRDVALKTIRPDRPASADQAARFVHEARVTGRLEHPCIVPVHDLLPAPAGPRYVMRFVSGRTLTEAAAEYHQRRAAGQAGRLELVGLLDAFVAVCRAVAFAHSKGVIHRDLKGQNVVLGEYGEVFLVDWGLAKGGGADDAGDPAGGDGGYAETAAGARMGTPAFMAPEVAARQPATARSDVYGLGAILYEVLTGQPPHTGGSAAEVLEKVASADPPAARAVNPHAPPALEAVCRKAMARRPEDRYAAAADLATDVRRWLADEPVSVYRERWLGRAARWARRHRTGVAAAAALVLTAAVASAVALALVWRQQQQTEAARQDAADNAAAALQVVRDLGSYVDVIEFSGSSKGVSDAERKRMLDASLASYERLLALQPHTSDLRLTVARTHRFRANLCRLLNQLGEAERSYQEALRHYRNLAAESPDELTYRKSIADASRDYGMLLKRAGRLRDASRLLDDAASEYQSQANAHPDSADSRRVLALILLDRAELEYLAGRFPDAERTARAAADLYAGLADVAGSHPEVLDPLFRGMAENRVAMALREQGRLPDALAAHDAAVGRLAAGVKANPSRDFLHNHARYRAERAWTAARLPDRREAALAELDEVIPVWEKLTKQFAQVPLYGHWRGRAILFRGRVNALLGRRDAAVKDLSAAAAALEALAAKYPDLPDYRYEAGRAHAGLAELTADPGAVGRARELLDGVTRQSPENVEFRQAREELDAAAKKSGR